MKTQKREEFVRNCKAIFSSITIIILLGWIFTQIPASKIYGLYLGLLMLPMNYKIAKQFITPPETKN